LVSEFGDLLVSLPLRHLPYIRQAASLNTALTATLLLSTPAGST